MVKARKWLDKNYPKEGREQVKELNIINKNLEGELDFSDFRNLELLDCRYNELTRLNLNKCSELEKLNCSNNYLTQIIYPTNPKKITILSIENNNLSEQDLVVFSQFENLESLNISNNHFTNSLKPLGNLSGLKNLSISSTRIGGSLEYLKDLNRLETLNISHTNVNSGVEYLPKNLERIYYETKERPDCKLTEIEEQLNLFTKKELRKPWREAGFTRKEALDWTNVGLKLNEYIFADYLTQQGYQPTTPQIKEIITQESWRDIHPDFTYQLRKDWEKFNFTYKETKKWINLKIEPTEVEFVRWLIKKESYESENLLIMKMI